jgi:6-phosphogluconolactonase
MGENGIGNGQLTVFEDGPALAEGVAHWLMERALAKKGHFSLCLSGGSTPKVLYQRLAQPPFRDSFPWDRTDLFFGDERFVPAGDKDSNFTMASTALLDHVPIPKANVFRMVTEVASAQVVADTYEATLKRYYGAETLDAGRPLFDVNLLGLGPDGHTASLLPGQPVLEERTKWVADVSKGRPEARITLTYPVLESASAIAFLVVGAEKAAMLAHVRAGATDVPAGGLRTTAEIHFFADKAAVGTAKS